MLTCLVIAKHSDKLQLLRNQLEAFDPFSRFFYQSISEEAWLHEQIIPDVIYMYVQGNQEDNQDLLQCKIVYPKAHIIVISSCKSLAYSVFKYNLLHFLIFPFVEPEVVKCVQKVKRHCIVKKNTLCIRSYRDYQYIKINDILFLKADNNTTDFYINNMKRVHGFKTLKSYQSRLPSGFLRIHKSYLINTNKIRRIDFGKRNCELTGCQQPIPFSKSFTEELNQLNETLMKKAY
ncbi:LytR/AlgR family response regulator transcription factor [Mesonia aquimarina]|uniref:LytR/AlgR family response regulator transcription factor n=1 Tax=Mesonia aquimarina TaxID=1504967 RepID=UPI000EF57E73|nr:LytTR family transcriptional regulator DNA-binding domain-containing protein [Mesonia aquimarina]